MDKSTVKEKVELTLKEKVTPALEEHFGGAEITDITDDGVLYVKMTGACGSCPSAKDELEGVIKETIIAECPEITDVRLDDSVSEDLLDFARKILNKDR